ncbi:MAG: Do family serine endopeptidase [Bacteroidales bacterium]|nr:Do family serine endopeptidase [Bacteroidales bacterium]
MIRMIYKRNIMKRNLTVILFSVVLSVTAAVIITNYINESPDTFFYSSDEPSSLRQVVLEHQNFPDFTYAAESCVDAVVFVKVVKREKNREASILEHFFGYGNPYSMPRESVNSGSGVIISPDGYIVTNNHVVANGEQIEVTLNDNKTYKAKLVGADAVTDVALLKVEAEGLPVIPFGDSDSLRLGEWVLAIGSPFNLRSTITAGIVSAKGRSLPDMRGEFKIESFIQTDAAVNPGNSGGALVNTKGELVGINTAIASNTGSYTGYSFAVPVAIVKKVVDDIKEYGSVKRAVLGISMTELTQELASLAGMKGDFSGVYIADINKTGAAYAAGVREGDILVAINGRKMKSPSEVQAAINGYKPGDVVELLVYRDGKEMPIPATLLGESNAIAAAEGNEVKFMGATLADADEDALRKLRLRGGVEIKAIEKGKFKDAGITKGLIITHINQTPVSNVKEALDIMKSARRGFLVEGVYGNGEVYYYGVGV